MPWIPVVDVASTPYLNKEVTGPPASFVYWWYPWAADLGGTAADCPSAEHVRGRHGGEAVGLGDGGIGERPGVGVEAERQ
jgi:hypothetical protein